MSVISARRPQLIISADDFGRDEPCTVAIADALARGAISATSIMAGGSHFEQACAIVRSERFQGRIGVHLALDEGPALSREMAPFTDGSGQLCIRRGLKPLTPRLSRAIEAELTAQIERVLGMGIRPTHLDSHRHIHTAFPIGRLVVRMARRYNIPYVRPARNLAARPSVVASLYKSMFNRYLASHVTTADYFGDIVDFYRHQNEHGAPGLIECMTHLDETPRGVENLRLIRSPEFIAFLDQFQLISHAEISH